MKAELKENLDKVIEAFLLWGADDIAFSKGEEKESISGEESERRCNLFYEIIESGDPEVLRGLIGMLTMKVGGGCALDEGFPQEIFHHYTKEQIAEAVFEQFDAIYDNDERPDGIIRTAYILEGICSDIWGYGRDEEGFQIFRRLFNKIRPRHAERFLNEMEKYKNEEKQPMIATLREDMKKWGEEEKEAKL
jgi:hypothetical protein